MPGAGNAGNSGNPDKLLQLCPHDTAPFGDLVALYTQAGQSIGLQVESVFLGHPAGQPLAGADYLGVDNLADTLAVSRALQRYAGDSWSLILCHRYRSYWAAVRSRLPNEHCVVLAHEYGLLNRWQRRLNRLLFARQVQFAGVSPTVADELARFAGAARVLPNGLDVGQTRAQLLSREAALTALQLATDRFTVGVVGRLHYKKRPRLALHAFQQFAGAVGASGTSRQPPPQLVFLGDGEQRDELQKNAGDDVHFLGSITDARRYLRAFDAILYPALADSFGMVVLEALDAGVPVVCNAAHGPQYVLGELGFYAATDDAAGFAAGLGRAQQVEQRELTERGRLRVDQYFSTAAVARALDDLLIAVDKTGDHLRAWS